MLKDKLTDLDYAILATLPPEGSRMGSHTYAKQVITMREELGDATSAGINGRLRSLKHHELVVSVVVQPVNDGMGWQITQKGLTILSDRRSTEGATIHQLPQRRREGA